MTYHSSVSGDTRTHVTPIRLPREAATRRLRSTVLTFFNDVEAWIAAKPCDPETVEGDGGAERGATPPRLAIAGEASLGKTEEIIAALRGQIAQGRRVLYLVPQLPLADELADRARAHGIEKVAVVRGRSQEDPERPGETMCAKEELAGIVAALGFGVTETLCKDKNGNECEFYAGCAYIRQLAELRKGGGLLIGAHQYLPLAMDLLKEDRIDLVVIDESFWQAMVRSSAVSIDRLTTIRQPNGASRQYQPKKGETRDSATRRLEDDTDAFISMQATVNRVIRAALDAGRDVTVADLRAAGLTEAECGFAKTVEYSRLGTTAGVHPAMPLHEQREKLKSATAREAFQFARFWSLLAAELASGRDGPLQSIRLEIGRLNRKSGDLENVVAMDYTADARFQKTPVLMIDANADEAIIDRFYPCTRVEKIAAQWSNVRVRQVTDRTGSKKAFENPANRERVRTIGLDLADQMRDRCARPEQRPLVVVQKHVEDAWSEAGHRLDYDGGEAAPDAPFQVAHFGNLRGKDRWKHVSALIVVGRIEPAPLEVERITRAVFFKSPEAVVPLVPDDRGRIILPKRSVRMTAKDETTATVAVSYHPDDRADRVLRQIREAELSQTIARVRPVHRQADAPCEVLVLTNVPLDIEPDSFATWDQIVPDRFRQMELRGFLPDLAPDCAAAYPDLWDSADAVRQAASRRARMCDGSYYESFYGLGHTFERGVRVTFRLEGNRRGRQATVAAQPGDTPETVAQRVRGALPGVREVEILGPLPDPMEHAQAALDAAEALDAYVAETEAAGDAIWWRVRPETRRAVARWNGTLPPEVTARRPDPDQEPFAFR